MGRDRAPIEPSGILVKNLGWYRHDSSEGQSRRNQEVFKQQLVITRALELSERFARGVVSDIDVTQTPSNLSDRIGAPISTDDLHLGSWKGLRDSMSPGPLVTRFVIPIALFGP